MNIYFVFAALGFFVTTNHASPTKLPSGTQDPNDRSCASIHDLPPDVFQVISNYSSMHDMASLRSATRNLNGSCAFAMAERRRLFYVGDTPTLIPAVKRCMIQDDTECFKWVMKHFALDNFKSPWRVRQLPALAAQLGATRIFKLLNVTSQDPQWITWMTRAAARGHKQFLSEIAPDLPYEYNKYQDEVSIKHFYSGLHFSVHTAPPGRVLVPFYDNHHLPTDAARIHKYNSWMNLTLFEMDAYPNVTQIFETVQIKNVKERAVKIQELKSQIQTALNNGAYLLDDMIGVSDNTVRLWWNFGENEMNITSANTTNADGGRSSSAMNITTGNTTTASTDGGRSSFITWLIDEGAPMNDRECIAAFVSEIEGSNSKYIQWIKLNAQYTIGSTTVCLSKRLQNGIDSSLKTKQYLIGRPELPFFKEKLDADIYDPSAMKRVVKFMAFSQKNVRKQFIDYYATNGLQLYQLHLLRAYFLSLPDSEEYRYRYNMLFVVSDLAMKMMNHQIRSSSSYAKASDVLSWWMSLVW